MKIINLLQYLIKNIELSDQPEFDVYDIPPDELWVYNGHVITSINIEPINEDNPSTETMVFDADGEWIMCRNFNKEEELNVNELKRYSKIELSWSTKEES